MADLLDTLKSDAEQLVESELPAIADVRGIVGALIKRVEKIVPTITSEVLAPVKASQTQGVAPAGNIGSPTVVPAQQAAPVATAAQPIVTSPSPTMEALLAQQAQINAQIAAAQAPAPAAPSVQVPAAPAAGPTPAEIQAQIAQLQAQLGAAVANAQAPAVTSA